MRKLVLAISLFLSIFLIACNGVTEVKEDETSGKESSEKQLAQILPGLRESTENNCDLMSLSEVKNILGNDTVSIVNDKYSTPCLFKYGSAPFGSFNLELKKFASYKNTLEAQNGFESYKTGKTVEVVKNLGNDAFFISETGNSKVKLNDGSDYAVTGSGLYVIKDNFIVYVMMDSTDQLYLSAADRLEKMKDIANSML